MDFLTAEIARKRKEIASTVDSSANKKYIRQKDVAAERERQYQEDQERLKAEREAKAAVRLEETRKREEAARIREAKLKKEKEDKLASERAQEKVLTDEEVKNRLRELEEPVTLFAETEEARKVRLEDAELKAAVERKKKARIEAAKNDDTPALEPLESLSPDAPELKVEMSDLGRDKDKLYEKMYRYFKVMCQEWAKTMDERDPEIKASPQGIAALKIQQQCIEDFKPLFRALKRKVCQL
jgi:pre-mRNA-splicing factor 18